jgi:PTS system D-glucosamine-specific IIC component
LAKLDACITRLRVSVKDVSKVNKERLRALGASGIMQVDKNLQIIFGTKSEKIKEQITDILRGERHYISPSEDKQLGEGSSISGKDMIISMPMTGKLMPISEVPDKTFSEKILGDGFAILPKDGTVVSPADGKVAVLFPTKHAIAIVADNGLEMLIHVGIDTVKLNGEGFEAFVKQGDVVKRGQVLLKANLEYISKNAPSTISPIVFTNLSSDERIEIIEERDVKIGETGCVRIIKRQPVPRETVNL